MGRAYWRRAGDDYGQLTDFFWQYDNNGLKLAQLRFYQVSTNVQ